MHKPNPQSSRWIFQLYIFFSGLYSKAISEVLAAPFNTFGTEVIACCE